MVACLQQVLSNGDRPLDSFDPRALGIEHFDAAARHITDKVLALPELIEDGRTGCSVQMHLVIPPSITGGDARAMLLAAKWFGSASWDKREKYPLLAAEKARRLARNVFEGHMTSFESKMSDAELEENDWKPGDPEEGMPHFAGAFSGIYPAGLIDKTGGEVVFTTSGLPWQWDQITGMGLAKVLHRWGAPEYLPEGREKSIIGITGIQEQALRLPTLVA